MLTCRSTSKTESSDANCNTENFNVFVDKALLLVEHLTLYSNDPFNAFHAWVFLATSVFRPAHKRCKHNLTQAYTCIQYELKDLVQETESAYFNAAAAACELTAVMREGARYTSPHGTAVTTS